VPEPVEYGVKMLKRELIQKIENKSAVIAIVGMGYVGLPLMLRFSEVGYRVIGIDIDASKVEQLNRGESYIQHIRPEAIHAALASGFAATTDFAQACSADARLIVDTHGVYLDPAANAVKA